MSKLRWSALINHANWLELGADIQTLAEAGCDELEVEVSDGVYAPRSSSGFDAVRAIRSATQLPVHVHLLAERPERHIDAIVETGVTGVTVPLETCLHAHRIVQQVKDSGLEMGMSVNPATSLAELQYVLPELDRVVLWIAEPGAKAETLSKSSFERIRILRENVDYLKLRMRIQVKGGLDVESGALAFQLGADVITLDESNVFGRGDLLPALIHYREQVEQHLHLV